MHTHNNKMTENELPYRERLALIRQGLAEKTTKKKEPKPLRKVSLKKEAENKAAKEAGTDGEMDAFFKGLRKSMTGRCLFCNGNTMKQDDDKFHFSLAHLMPKSIFKSVATHPDIIIELCFYGNSCHTNFDNGMITWLTLKDSKEWDIIKEKLLTVLPMVAQEERKHKLYTTLIELVYGNQ